MEVGAWQCAHGRGPRVRMVSRGFSCSASRTANSFDKRHAMPVWTCAHFCPSVTFSSGDSLPCLQPSHSYNLRHFVSSVEQTKACRRQQNAWTGFRVSAPFFDLRPLMRPSPGRPGLLTALKTKICSLVQSYCCHQTHPPHVGTPFQKKGFEHFLGIALTSVSNHLPSSD